MWDMWSRWFNSRWWNGLNIFLCGTVALLSCQVAFIRFQEGNVWWGAFDAFIAAWLVVAAYFRIKDIPEHQDKDGG